MRYELGNEDLRIVFYDGLKGTPESFEPAPGRTDPQLVVVRLSPVR